MPALQEDVVLKLGVDASGVDAGLAKARASSANLGGSLGALNTQLDKIGGKSGADARAALGALGPIMGNSSAQAAQLFGSLGDVAGMLSGGPLAIGLAAAGVGFALLVKSIEDSRAAADKLVDDALKGFSALAAERAGIEAHIGAMRKELGLDERTVAGVYEDLEKRNKAARESVASMRAELAKLAKPGLGDNAAARREDLRTSISITEQAIELREREATTEMAIIRKRDAERADAANKVAAAEIEAEKRAAKEILDARKKLYADMAEEAMRGREWVEGVQREQYNGLLAEWAAEEKGREAHQASVRKAEARAARDAKAAKVAAHKAEVDALREAEAEKIAIIQQTATQAISLAVDGTQGLIDALITGQEHALELFAIGIARQAGSALIGRGIEVAGMAAASTAAFAFPIAAWQAGIATGLVGTGIALGGLATGAEHILAGGVIGQALPTDRAPTARGATSSKKSSGSSEPSTFHVEVNYGVAGPAPEDTARAVSKAARTAARRGIS